MFWTPCESPCLFCFNCLCAPCGAYRQREKLLGDAPYYCCMGAFPCCCLKNPCDKIPFLCCEVCLCTICAITANRSYIQRTKGVQNDACDNCLIWSASHSRTQHLVVPTAAPASQVTFASVHSPHSVPAPSPIHFHRATCICQWALCILQCLGQPVDPSLENAIDCFYYIVIGCMLTQQDIEINADIPAPQPQVMGGVINPQGNAVVNAPGTAPGGGGSVPMTQY